MSSIVTAWLTLSLMLLMTSLFATKGKLELDEKCGRLTQLLSCRISADIPRVPASAGLSLVATWFHWSTLVYKISQTRFATNIGCFSLEFIHWRTVVLSVHLHTWLTVTVSARIISFFSRAEVELLATPVLGQSLHWRNARFPQNKRKLCFYLASRSCYSGSKKCDGTKNIRGIVTELMQFYIIKGSSKITSRSFDVFKLW